MVNKVNGVPQPDPKDVKVLGSLVDFDYDKLDVTYPTTVSEIYTYSLDSVTVGVIEVVYTDDTKAFVLSVEKV